MMDSGNGSQAANGVTGQAEHRPVGEPTRDLERDVPLPPVPGGENALGAFPGEVNGDGTAGGLTAALKAGYPDEEDPPLTLLAEWALWGKDERNTGYHVMLCSKGQLTAKVFSEIITRYGSGVKPSLPQYTACWIPGPQGDPEYLALGIHEVVKPGEPSTGGRRQNVGGRVVEYVRLFCFRYADVAEFGASYTELRRAVADIPLVAGQGRGDLIPVALSPGFEPAQPAGTERGLAEHVALALLTGSPVCILDANGVPADRRLAFIDLVLSLLPFGLRATLSASTSASTTKQDLKLRLYFSSAPREDGGRTYHVSWVRPGPVTIPPGREAVQLYGEWLREAGPGAIGDLALKTVPRRFTEADELQMLKSLPNDKSVAESLRELADKLRAVDQPAVSAIVKRLKRYLAVPQSSADRAVYRSLILQYRLLGEHPGIHGNTKASVYRALLRLGFATPLPYAAYCDIEDSVGGRLSWPLRKVLLESQPYVLVCVLAALAEPSLGHALLGDGLAAQDIEAGTLLNILDREIERILPRHRATLIDFTLWYLRRPDPAGQRQAAEDPRVTLYSYGYLTSLLHRAFPQDQSEQRHRVSDIIRRSYGERLGQRQISEIFAARQLYPGPAIEAAVKRLAAPQHRRFAEKQAAAARLRYAGYAADVTTLLEPTRLGMPWRAGRPRLEAHGEPGTARLLLPVVIGLVLAGAVVLALFLIQQGL